MWVQSESHKQEQTKKKIVCFFMLSIERVKQLANDPTLSDKQIEEIRDGFYMLSQVIFEQWQAERNKAKEVEQKDNKKINNQNEYEKPTEQQQ